MKISQKPRKRMFWGGCEEIFFFVKLSFLGKIGKRCLCSEGTKKRAFSLQLSVFGKWSNFWCPFKVTKHYKNRAFSRHMGKTQNGAFGCKSAILGRGRKGALLSVIPESCALLKTLFLSCFQRNTALQK